jgi:DNA topoisomerase I
MTNLVIVESPAKCQKIQGFLGRGWKVIASMGHIRALEETLDAVGIANDFEPSYTFMKEKSKTLKQLKEEAEKATEIYLASDADREGEAIAFSVALLLKLNPRTAKRIKFNEITERAIKSAVESPTTIDMNMVNAQQTRAMLDMMIGFTISPLLWKHVAPALSAGRCQSVSLRLLVEREQQINSFAPSSSWKIDGEFQQSLSTPTSKFTFQASLEDELEDEESAKNYLDMRRESPDAQITDTKLSTWKENPPQPLITSTLQQQASALYNMSPKTTMKIAQTLYEQGHITYMRTDKAILSEEAKTEARKWVEENYGNEYVLPVAEDITNTTNDDTKPKKKKSSKKEKEESDTAAPPKAQEAHEAIRPTHMDIPSLPESNTYQERNLYKLIWQRAVQSVMSPCTGENYKVRFQCNGDEENEFFWSTTWKRTIFDGWRRAGKIATIEESDENETDASSTPSSSWTAATKLKKGDKLSWKTITAKPHETRPTPRFTEASLVKELESYGIGRPSTFASLLSVIQDKNYAEIKDIEGKNVQLTIYTLTSQTAPLKSETITKKVGGEKKKLVPTALGISVLDFILQHFTDLFNYSFTSQMEKRLDHIAEGTEEWKQILRDMWNSYKDRYEDLKTAKSTKPSASERTRIFSNGIKGIITKNGQPVLMREGEKKEDTVFLGWPSSSISFAAITDEQVCEFTDKYMRENQPIGTYEDHPIYKKKGKFGPYVEWNGQNISIDNVAAATNNLEKIIEKIREKVGGSIGVAEDGTTASTSTPLTSTSTSGVIMKFKDYEIRNGQYGPYIMKTSLKQKKFVSVPKTIKLEDIKNLTEKETEGLYKIGLENKKHFSKYGKDKK